MFYYFLVDISLVDWGRKEIIMVENEMFGLMEMRKKYGFIKFFIGVKIVGCLYMII